MRALKWTAETALICAAWAIQCIAITAGLVSILMIFVGSW